VAKWLGRFRAEGVAGMLDRSSRPHRLRHPTPPETVARIEALRRERWIGAQVARETGVSKATVSRILRRLGLNKLRALEPADPVRRYEREHPGELIHIDIKKLGKFNRTGHRITGDRRGQSNSRGVGWEFVHVCIDDASRVAFTQIKPNEKKRSATAFLRASVTYYESLGIKVERVMTDNGSCYKARAPVEQDDAIGAGTNEGCGKMSQRGEVRTKLDGEGDIYRRAHLADGLHQFVFPQPIGILVWISRMMKFTSTGTNHIDLHQLRPIPIAAIFARASVRFRRC
jgi:hypothetical protein